MGAVAMGCQNIIADGSKTSAKFSFACGAENRIALGNAALADYAVAIGLSNEIGWRGAPPFAQWNAFCAVAMGQHNTAAGASSVAIGS